MPTERFLPVAEASRRATFSRTGLYPFIHSGELPAVLILGKLRIRESDLEAWLERHTEEYVPKGATLNRKAS